MEANIGEQVGSICWQCRYSSSLSSVISCDMICAAAVVKTCCQSPLAALFYLPPFYGVEDQGTTATIY